MSLISWLFPEKAKRPAKSQPDSSGLSRMEPTRPVRSGSAPKDSGSNNGQPANRKGERMARRELLYVVVRDAMTRAGVLSASYKFKVLSLDARGRQFLVMVDLARDYGGETSRLAEIEALIAQGAKVRHDIVVTAVYWRMNEHVAVGDPQAAANRAKAEPVAHDIGQAVLDSAPVPLAPIPEPAPVVKQERSHYEPIRADEVAAFKAAIAQGATKPAAVAAAAVGVGHGASATAFDGSHKHGPQSYTLLTGFEDTEVADGDTRAPALSGTQYGDLR